MTDEQIIKALEYCKEQGITSECPKCPIKADCRRELIAIALDFINRQQTQLHKEQNKNSKVRNERNRFKAEVERLKMEREALDDAIYPLPFKTDFDIAIETAKVEAYKEFAERLKNKIRGMRFLAEAEFQCEEVDNLVKELTEGNENA
jgi:hypothetical protein